MDDRSSLRLHKAHPRWNSGTPFGHAWPSRYTFADIIGRNAALVRARELAWQAAQGGSCVLLVGESGTGKELFAHAIHAASPRHAYPFVPVDCAAIPRGLVEAELFGYAPGAFTGAARQGKAGQFELAQGGTIFLDEIGEMPPAMQGKLLRVLQERLLIRVGGVAPISLNCAVIAATNRNVERLVAQGRFRQELLYRLDVIRIEVPPLRERVEDIPLLVEHYWARKGHELGRAAKLSARALRLLEGYSWPGNIRELINMVERLLVGVAKPVIGPEDLPPQLQQAWTRPGQSALMQAEGKVLQGALQEARGNRTRAAQLLGVSRSTFYRKLKGHGLLVGDPLLPLHLPGTPSPV